MKPSENEVAPSSLLPDFSGNDIATKRLFEKWRRDDETNDPTAIAKAEAEVEEFIRNMNRNRVEAGESSLL